MLSDIQSWMKTYVNAMKETFGERVVFVGLQGSCGRGEAGEQSDIDVVLILDRLSTDDLQTYKNAIAPLPAREKICGFVSGKCELERWEKSDLFSFYHDTVPFFGSIEHLAALIGKSDAKRCVLNGACGVYHACCHNFVFENDPQMLRALKKSAFFILRAKYFCETNSFIKRKSELLTVISEVDRAVLEADPLDFPAYSQTLLHWAGGIIRDFGADDFTC